jgi:hypothetical protein
MHIDFRKQNIWDKKQVLHMGFEAKHGFQNNTRVSIKKRRSWVSGTY